MADVQITLSKSVGETKSIVGTGVSRMDGRFELFLPDGTGPLWLDPGEYIVTAESVGSTPLVWEEPIGDVLLSPIRLNWVGPERDLIIELPDPLSW